jgi:two-component system CheB/CheR fusion protein
LSVTEELEATLGVTPLAEVSPQRLRRFFTKDDGKYRVSKALRDLCVFAKHNVAADPPFSHLDLVSCQNLLIYLTPALQKQVISTFHYALNQPGFLVLGTSETIGSFTDLFGVVDYKHRIYVKKATGARQYPHFRAEDFHETLSDGARSASPSTASTADWQKEADRIVMSHYAPAGVLVNDNLDILQFRGRTSPYLEPAPGVPSHNLAKMTRESFFLELRRAVTECRRQNAPVGRQGVRVRDQDQVREVDLRVLPIKFPGDIWDGVGPLRGTLRIIVGLYPILAVDVSS